MLAAVVEFTYKLGKINISTTIRNSHPLIVQFINRTNVNDKDWHTLNLLHDWSIEKAFSEENSERNAWLLGGIVWYRKSLTFRNQMKESILKSNSMESTGTPKFG